jgi:hypothetical protein
VVPPGYRFVLNVRGNDFDHGLGDKGFANAMYPMHGVGNLLHNDPQDRPAAIFGGRIQRVGIAYSCFNQRLGRTSLMAGSVAPLPFQPAPFSSSAAKQLG